MDNTLKIVTGVVIAVLAACVVFFVIFNQSVITVSPSADTSVQSKVTVYFFYGEECPHCHNVMPFIQNLSIKYPDVDFQILETWHNETNANFFNMMNDQFRVPNNKRGVPEVMVVGNNTPLIGEGDIPAYLEGVILEQLKKKQ
jgi:thiol-disulfide isomerase/thioredoxin